MPQHLLGQLISVGDAIQVLNPTAHDLLDIALIAIVFFFILKFLVETHSTTFLFGVLGLTLLYGLSSVFDLPLSHQVVSALFGTLLIIIAIISQRELRRFFTFFGSFQFPHHLRPPSDAMIDTMSAAIFALVKKKAGALFVFPGRESIDRYLESGVSLRGDISLPLILSIFDSSSPGHDGALVIENNKIRRFGVHLPLAEGNLKKVRNFGLRHRAALGLSERSDAMIVAVSEEKGTVHIFENSTLILVENEALLREKLTEFYGTHFPEFDARGVLRWSLRNVAYLAIAFASALMLWGVVNSGFAIVQRNFVVTPEFKGANAKLIVGNSRPDSIEVDLKGRSYAFGSLKLEDIRVVVDLSGASSTGWRRIDINPEDISVPLSFSVVKISPENLEVQLVKNQSP